MDLQAAMFDMDGVLFDSMKNHAYSWHNTMKHFGFDLPEWEAYMHEGRTGAGTINIVSLRERGCNASEEEIAEIYKYKSDLFNTLPVAERMPGAYELLQKVKSCGVVPMVVTGSGQKTLLERLNKNFPGIFRDDLMVTAFDVKYGKPNPEPYLMGMEKFSRFCNIDFANADFVSQNTSDLKEEFNKPSLSGSNGCLNVKSGSGNVKSDEATVKAFSKTKSLSKNNFIVVENAPLGVQAGVASGVFTIAVNTGPLPDDVLLNQGANLLFHSMQEFCDNWELLMECVSVALCR